MCSDLSQLKIAYASAASAALPLVLSPITYQNFAGQCGYQELDWLIEARRSDRPAGRVRANELQSYLNQEKRPYIHLLDGGLSDNIALRGLMEGAVVRGGLEKAIERTGIKNVRKLVILSVNAETSPDIAEFKSDEIPVFSRAFGSLVDIPINRYSADTLLIMRFAIEKWREELRNRPAGGESGFAPDAEIYFIDASFGAIKDQEEREYLMKIPTTLYLTDEQIERVQLAASKLIRGSPDFQRLMQDLQTGASK
jgi:NTE family protein